MAQAVSFVLTLPSVQQIFSGLFGSAVEPPTRCFQTKAIRPVEVVSVDILKDHKRDLVSFKNRQSKYPKNEMYFSF